MLLIPFDRKIDWNNAPVVTIVLLVVNMIAFFGLQSGESRSMGVAIKAYFESDLHKIEFPQYVRFLKKEGRLATGFVDEKGQPIESVRNVFELQFDHSFMSALHANKIIFPDHESWFAARTNFENLLSEVVWYKYGFKPGERQVTDLFVHMFLHGSFMHLLGNMFFLFAVGFMVEASIGHRFYLLSYILGGLGSVTLDVILNHYSITPRIGASGAISGIMGLYAILFGMRKVNFFYFIFVYFDYVKAPALLLLVVWLGNEVFQQLMWSAYSNVNYLAHIGGLLTGGVLGYVFSRRFEAVDVGYLDAKDHKLQFDTVLGKAECFIKNLEHEKAVPILQKLLIESPHDQRLMAKLNYAAKYQPTSESYHEIALKIFALKAADPATDQLIVNTFKDYKQWAKPKPRMNSHLVNHLTPRLLRAGELAEAEWLVRIMAKNITEFPVAKVYLLRLGQSLIKQQQTNRGHQYLKFLVDAFPESDEALIAKRVFET